MNVLRILARVECTGQHRHQRNQSLTKPVHRPYTITYYLASLTYIYTRPLYRSTHSRTTAGAMKKLFRTSKSTVDPLPPPNIPTSTPDARSPPPPPPPSGKKGFQALMGGNNGHEDHKGWGFNLGGEKVTPFPIDMGRDREAPGGGGVLKKKEKTKVPTLQEMQPDWRGSNGHYEPPSNHPYLPPGARPPSPPPALRPGTPTRYPYASTPSQSSQTSVHRDETPRPVPVHARDRGYSSASDSEPPVPLPKMNPIRSPLAYHPTPEEYSRSPPTHQQYHPQHPEQHWSAGQDDRHEEPKEKKKFWGVAWGGEKKDKHKDRELARPVDDKRASFEGYRENESVGHGSTGHHSHHSQSLNHSNQYPVQMSQGQHDTGIESAENVTQAIGTSITSISS
jgi:hypothetical protein